MNRAGEISDFLTFYANLYQQNPSLPITCDTFYDNLMKYDTGNEFERDTKQFFPQWLKTYNKKSIFSYDSESWCRFHIGNSKDGDPVFKLYVNLPFNYVDYGVKRVLDFMTANRIATETKVGSIVRADGFVIRLYKKEDVEKVVNFINNDSVLSKAARKTNPFMARMGIVGGAYDGGESYNRFVSVMLTSYFKTMRKNNSFDKVSLSDFFRYVTTMYDMVFSNKDAMQNFFLEEMHLSWNYMHLDDLYNDMFNYRKIFDMMITNMTRELQVPDFTSKIEAFVDRDEFKDEEIRKIEAVFNNNQQIAQVQERPRAVAGVNMVAQRGVEAEVVVDKRKILYDYVDLAIKKYGVCGVMNYLPGFVGGNINCITSSGNFRELFKRFLTPNEVLMFTDYDMGKYVADVYINNNRSKYELFINACIATLRKYGQYHFEGAVTAAMNGDFSHITDGGASRFRTTMEKSLSSYDVISIMQSLLMYNGIDVRNVSLAQAFSGMILQEVNDYAK